MKAIPDKGSRPEEVLDSLEEMRRFDRDSASGRSMTNVYLATEDAKRLAEEAYRRFLWENALDPTAYPSLPRMERDVVAMCISHLGGDERCVGSFTSGGTESVMMAVKAARDWARSRRPELDRPVVVMPSTAHPCFHKAGAYLGVEIRTVPVDPETCRVDPAAMDEAVCDRTIMLAASAPGYPHGVVDPIEEIAEIALTRNLLFHVDACIGGFVLPFLRELGVEIPAFDLSVEGVTSISMDLHKYAFCAKGASVVLYKDPDLRRHQFFAWSGWPGYVVLNPTVQSSKPGGPLAAAWAVLNHLGRDGYMKIFSDLWDATLRAHEAVRAITELRLMGEPTSTLFSLASDEIDVFALADAMKKRGWDMYPQLSWGGLPHTLHVTMLPGNVPLVGEWARDLADCVREVKENRSEDSLASVRAAVSEMDLSALSVGEIEELMTAAGIGASSLSGEMRDVNRLLDELPRDVCDKVLTVFLDRLTRPAR
ncbi:MAG: aspartate aminotransferase family protein [Acidimicrobiales bacterium]|nr:MAG: aspartate aminotransferase family protein [Acidimicrobiales bacterium]